MISFQWLDLDPISSPQITPMQDFKKLKVWQKAHDVTLAVYRCTRGFPREERFALVDQLRRAAMSVPSNIAEGAGRLGNREFRSFLSIAAGSASEVEYQLLLARDLDYISHATHDDLVSQLHEVKRMLAGLIRRVSNSGDQRSED